MQRTYVDLEGTIPAKGGDRVALIKTQADDAGRRSSREYQTALALRDDIQSALDALERGDIEAARGTLDLALSCAAWMPEPTK